MIPMYRWYISTNLSMSLYQYVAGMVMLFKCTGTAGTLVPATLCLCTNMLLVPHWYCCLYVLVLLFICTGTVGTLVPATLSRFVPIYYWYHTGTALYMHWHCWYCWYTDTSHSMSICLNVTGTALVLLFICTGTVGTLVPATLCLCAYILLVPHWYCSLYVLVLLVHWYQPLYVSVSICYWYRTGTVAYVYWYCWYCWYTGTSHSMSMCLNVTGTALVLLFICIGTAGTVGTLVPATLCLCAYMLLVPHWYCSLHLLVLLVHWYQQLCLCAYILLVPHGYCSL